MMTWLRKQFVPTPICTKFVCNICGQTSKDVEISKIGREDPSCRTCGSTVRMRSLIYGLSLHLYKKKHEFYPISNKIKKLLALA